MKLIKLINSFPILKDCDSTTDFCYELKGALTSSKLKQIPTDTKLLIVDSNTSFFLSYKQFVDLSNKFSIALMQKAELKSFVVILKDLDSLQFMKMCEKNLLTDNIILNPYVN